MRVLLLGNGGREAALAWRISRSPSLERLVVASPGPGWPGGVELAPARTPDEVVEVARRVGADLVVVGPEGPLEDGVGNALRAAGVACFGPDRAAARLETSKAFAKDVMRAAGVPTAGWLHVTRADRAAAEARCRQGDVVVKVDGLAAGKGVFVCRSADDALDALDAAWSGRFGEAADALVLEDLLEGPEVSLFALTDGDRVVALPSAQDHKRLRSGDRGPNTGGMGAYAPCPLVPDDAAEALVARIHAPVVHAMARRGAPFRGVLFAGLMLTPAGPRVLEFNVRFGDPECQPLMCLWEDDVLPWLHGAAVGRLPEGRPRFRSGAACCVVLAAEGYPDAPVLGATIPEPGPDAGVEVFLAGARRDEACALRVSGGRVLGVTGVGADLAEARARAYAAVDGWRFPGAQLRDDIGAGG